MKIFIDTNVLIDLLYKREGYLTEGIERSSIVSSVE